MVLVSVCEKNITIVESGKRLVLASGTKLYEQLVSKSKDEIVEWYKSRGI